MPERSAPASTRHTVILALAAAWAAEERDNGRGEVVHARGDRVAAVVALGMMLVGVMAAVRALHGVVMIVVLAHGGPSRVRARPGRDHEAKAESKGRRQISLRIPSFRFVVACDARSDSRCSSWLCGLRPPKLRSGTGFFRWRARHSCRSRQDFRTGRAADRLTDALRQAPTFASACSATLRLARQACFLATNNNR
jgi:hypothetical protein